MYAFLNPKKLNVISSGTTNNNKKYIQFNGSRFNRTFLAKKKIVVTIQQSQNLLCKLTDK